MKSTLLRLLCSLGLLAPVSAPWAADHCVILQYHHFSETTPRSTSVTPAEFDAHLEYLAANEFAILPLSRVIRDLRSATPLPDHCIAITVDDAYTSVYTEAFPRLQQRGWPFTLFLNTEAIDDGVSAYMDWDKVRELARAGVEIQNHSHSHAHLQRRKPGESEMQWLTRARQDIETAQRRIIQETGMTPTLFAYPYGEYNVRLKALLKELGLVSFGQHSGPAWSGADFQALPRFPLSGRYAAMPGFRVKTETLPLPVARATPEEPVLPVDEWQPQLTVELEKPLANPSALRCYISGQEPGLVKWTSGEQLRFTVTPKAKLAVGRNRYNCTAPSTQSGRYHWYSHNFFRRYADGRWYAE